MPHFSFSQCTRSKAGRSLKRHKRQAELDRMLSQAESAQGRWDRKTRQHLMERSFGRGTRYGIKRPVLLSRKLEGRINMC